MAAPKPIDREFNETYKNAGLQPSNKAGGQVRYVTAEKRFAANDPKYNDSTRNASVQGRTAASTDELFNAEYAKKGLQPQGIGTRKKKKTKQDIKQAGVERQKRRGVMGRLAAATPYGRAAMAASAMNRATTGASQRRFVKLINMQIWSWGSFLWLWVQLPIAVLSLIAFGIAYTVAKFDEVLSSGTESDNFFIRNVSEFGTFSMKILDFVLGGAEAALEFILGFNIFAIFDPTNVFMVTWIFIIGVFGVFQLLLIWMIYKMAKIESIGGSWSGFKFGMLMLTFIGYCIPFLNLFPWYMTWTSVVWFKPK